MLKKIIDATENFMRSLDALCFALLSMLLSGISVVAQPDRSDNIVPVYQRDFSHDLKPAAGSAWSVSDGAALKRGTTPKGGRKFLGLFAEHDRLELRLKDLPEHALVRLRLTVFMVYGHDGNDEYFGPDIWGCEVLGGPRLLHSTFCNVKHLSNLNEQNFPADFPHGSFPAGTGSTEFGSLGWIKAWGKVQHPVDSVYELEFVFPHRADELGLAFYSECAENWLGECWGLESVIVEVLREPVALSDAELRNAWLTLQMEKDASAHDAIWTLASAGPKALDLVRGELDPQGETAADLRKLILQLAAPKFRERRDAGRQLLDRGPAIARFLETERARHLDVPEIKIRTRDILDHWQEQKVTLADPEVRARVLKYLSVVGAATLQATIDARFPAER